MKHFNCINFKRSILYNVDLEQKSQKDIGWKGQAYLGEIVGSAPDHRNKANTAIK